MNEESIFEIPSHRGSYLASPQVKTVKRQDPGHFTQSQLHNGSVLVKAAKIIGFVYIGGSWPTESLQFRGT